VLPLLPNLTTDYAFHFNSSK